ncbi:MAG TPA: 2-amino-4-hydroxy-6-hydroxymethyldihydropteridine diphosphokinase [Burkholderiales bacterium]|nr:2-amino-4-hydroxy-6-hydroxymethyldihydropteridine diphosphokinase [Burkholderiales bacterium]
MSGCVKPRPLCRAFVGLGGNIGDPAAQLARGLQELAQLPGTRVLARSSLYRSAAVGTGPQPDYLNSVAEIETGLTPSELLDALLAIERRHGRTREFPNAPRTLDLDVLMYEDLQCHEHGLTLPHPRMHERLFVLLPLLEIAPGCTIPGRGPAAGFVVAAAGQKVVRLP